MDKATHNKIVSFIWGIADDVLRNLFKRGKYPNVILPMFVLRRMDAVLEPTKKTVLETKEMLNRHRSSPSDAAALAAAAGQSYYNTSRFTLRDLKSRGNQQQLLCRFKELPQRVLAERPGHPRKLQIPQPFSTLSKSDSLGTLIEQVPRSRNQSQPRIPSSMPTTPCTRAWTITPSARSSRNWSASSTRKTTRRRASTGHPATPSLPDGDAHLSPRSPMPSAPALICSTMAPAASAAC